MAEKAPPAEKRGQSTKTTFPMGLGEMFGRGFSGYFSNIVPLTLAAAVSFAVLGAFGYYARQLLNDDLVYQSDAVILVGLIACGTVSYPWYSYALDAARGNKIDIVAPLKDGARFKMQAVASFWFWAGVLLGFRYLFRIPAIFVMLLYAFHGFAIASGRVKGGLIALGTSVRLGEKRRIGLLALGLMLVVFNMFGAVGGFIDLEMDLTLRWLLSGIGLLASASISLVLGAALFDALWEDMGDDVVLARLGPAGTERKPRKKKGKRRKR